MQIIVHIAAAKQSITVEIENSSSTIEDVKKVIKNREEGKELPMDKLDLVFQGTILDDGRMVSYYNIQDGSILNMAFQLRGETVQVFVEDLTGKTYRMEIGESATVDDLKNKIEDVIGIEPDRQRLVFMERQLEDRVVILDLMRLIHSKVLESMYKDNGRPTIYMVLRLRGGANVVVHHRVKWADASIKIVKSVDTGCKSRNVGCWASLAKCWMLGLPCKHSKKRKGKGGIESMQIYVVSAGAKHWITLEIENSSSTIENVKNVIKNIEEGKEIPMDELDLVFQGTILEEEKTVSHYNIQHGSTLNMAFQLRGQAVQVFLKTESRWETFTMEIGESHRVEDLKNKIEDFLGIPSNQQRLLFNGELLVEGVILDHMRLIQSRVLESGDQEKIHAIYKHNGRPTIYMVLRLRESGGNVVHHPVKWPDGSSSPPKRSSTAIKIVRYVDTGCKSNLLTRDASQGVLDAGPPLQTHDAGDDNVMTSDDHTSCFSGSSSMNRLVSCEKCKRLLFDEEFNSKVVKEVANSLKGDDWDRLSSSLRDVPNISRTRILDALDLFEEKPNLIRLFLSLNPKEKDEWLVRKLGY